jgi:hypothetical protein
MMTVLDELHELRDPLLLVGNVAEETLHELGHCDHKRGRFRKGGIFGKGAYVLELAALLPMLGEERFFPNCSPGVKLAKAWRELSLLEPKVCFEKRGEAQEQDPQRLGDPTYVRANGTPLETPQSGTNFSVVFQDPSLDVTE